MQLIAGLFGVMLAFASMWVGWYVLKVWPDLYHQAKVEHPDLDYKL
jgi:hypothetical protein